ncbi:MAG TPA: NAD(P)-dependent oxidoreductase [Solibacterales bacterium]|nr:NAD(P)-dependent oxidoreductase [Bryobacterales bacterium]
MAEDQTHRIVITGATGTLGRHAVELLSSDPNTHILLPLRRLDPALAKLPPNVQTQALDLTDAAQMRRMFSEFSPDVIIHCAASGVRPDREDWFAMTRFNTESALQLFESACRLPDCHFIHISTALVYCDQGRPLRETDPLETRHPYAASKAAADLLLQAAAVEFDRRLTLLRPFTFTGAHDGGRRLFPALLRAAAAGQPFPMSPGAQRRDFCAAQDIAEAIRAAVHTPRREAIEIFNLGSGVDLPLRTIVGNVCRELQLGVDLQFGALPYHPQEPMHLVADIDKAAQLPWKPRTNLAYAVWELAQSTYPGLAVCRPRMTYE